MKRTFRNQGLGSDKTGPSHHEMACVIADIRSVEATCDEQVELLEAGLANLQLNVPGDRKETMQCQKNVNIFISDTKRNIRFLEGKNQSLIVATELLCEDIARQQKAQGSAAEVVRSFTPPDVMHSQSMTLRALSVVATELVHTRIFEDASRLGDIDSFKIAVKRTPDVNIKNSRGRSAIDYATEYMLAEGIRALVEKGANSSDALLYSLHMYLSEAAKLLVILTGQIAGYGEIFSKLREDILLTHLDLSSAKLTPEAVVHLSSVLTDNKYLNCLNLSNNNIGIMGSEALGKMLAANSTITQLDFSNANLGYEGIQYIATALEHNNAVKGLNVANDYIQEEGAIVLARLIEKNSNIMDLNLASNGIGDIGAAYIVDRLSKNSTILRINLKDNKITDALFEDIADMLRQNNSVMIFGINANQFSEQVLLEIEEMECKVSEANLHQYITNNDVVDEAYSLELLAELQQID